MPSIDAIDALIDSSASWDDYRKANPGKVDLRLAELKNLDLSYRDFSDCDFSGADLESVNLDFCNISNAIFLNAYLDKISLVNSKITKTDFTGAKLRHSIFRETKLTKVRFTRSNLQNASFHLSTLKKCYFIETNLDSANFEYTNLAENQISFINTKKTQISHGLFDNCTFSHSHFKELDLKNVRFEANKFSEVLFENSSLEEISFFDCKLVKLQFPSSRLISSDFSCSNISKAMLSQYNLSESIFMDVAFVNCEWPLQKGSTTLLGKYQKSSHLLGQPVQDIKGIPPTLRREIADAQYLCEIINSPSFFNKILLRIWGFTTNYGQSLPRLSILSLLLITSLAIAFLCFPQHPVDINFLHAVYKAFSEMTQTFIGISNSNASEFTHGQQICITLGRLSGYFVMGLWIGLAANQLGKLSSE